MFFRQITKIHNALVTTAFALLVAGCFPPSGYVVLNDQGEVTYRSPVTIPGDYFQGTAVAFSPDSSLVAIANAEAVWIADTKTHLTVAWWKAETAHRFSRRNGLVFLNNNELAVGVPDGVRVLDSRDRTTFKDTIINRDLGKPVLAWSAATGQLVMAFPKEPRVYKADRDANGNFIPVPHIHLRQNQVPVLDMDFSLDGAHLATAHANGVDVWEVASAHLDGSLPAEGEMVSHVQRFGNQRLLVAGDQVKLWQFLTTDQVADLGDPSLDGQKARQRATLAAAWLLFPLHGDPRIFTEGHKLVGVRMPFCGRHAAASPDGRFLVDVYPGATREIIHVIDIESGEKVEKLNPRGNFSCAVAFSPDNSKLVITSDKSARIYDTESWKFAELQLRAIKGAYQDIWQF